MSVRTEARDHLSPAMQQALHVPVDALQNAGVPMNTSAAPVGGIAEMTMHAPSEHALAEANSFNTSNPEHPLNRTVVVSIRASLNDLCLKKAAAVWSPSSEATKAILQQRKFVDLAGTAEAQGDLKVCFFFPFPSSFSLLQNTALSRLPRLRSPSFFTR